MNFLFWNIKREYKGNDKGLLLTALCHIIDEQSIDIVALAEYSKYLDQLNSKLVGEKGFTLLEKRSEKEAKVVVFYRAENVRVTIQQDMEYSSALKFISLKTGIEINGFYCHLRSQLYGSRNTMDSIAEDYIEEVVKYENEIGNRLTFICGDFNMNPFEAGMVGAKCFHSLMDAKLVARREQRQFNSKNYFTFYNPMWGLSGDLIEGKAPGTYFRNTSNSDEYFWYILDQVIIRPSLIEYFEPSKLKILSKGKDYDLMTRNKTISGKYSDHLPICFTLNF